MAEAAIGADCVVEQACSMCPTRFTYEKTSGRPRLFCSVKCKQAKALINGRAYRTAAHEQRYLSKGRGLNCPHCGTRFAKRGPKRFCTRRCYADSVRIHATPAESAAAEASRRRARKRTTQIERFTKVEIYERDGWVCQICEEPIDRAVKPPHHMSASLDHRIALANGGAHTRENVQCAHWICNSRKGAR